MWLKSISFKLCLSFAKLTGDGETGPLSRQVMQKLCSPPVSGMSKVIYHSSSLEYIANIYEVKKIIWKIFSRLLFATKERRGQIHHTHGFPRIVYRIRIASKDRCKPVARFCVPSPVRMQQQPAAAVATLDAHN